ncbi:MAG: hypothetical protein GF341_05750 [candidate division Zixibacteria bacterium]|nr:hypothetical protein [candidate division Zixibacteria bacterium]
MSRHDAVDPIAWILPSSLHRPAILYTIRLLSTLLGRSAVITTPDKSHTSGHPHVHYSDQPASADDDFNIPCDIEFWKTAEQGIFVTPRQTAEWNGATVPVWNLALAYDVPDVVAAAFFHVSRLEELARTERDRHGRYQASNSWLIRAGLIERPVVHDYAHAIATALGLQKRPGSMWPDDQPFAVALTHDIDRLRMHGEWQHELRHLSGQLLRGSGLGLIGRQLASRRRTERGQQTDPYETIDLLARQHQEHGFSATFYWIAAEPSALDSDYVVSHDDTAKLIRSLQDDGFETALHGSYNSYLSTDMLAAEREILSRVVHTSVKSTRQHYLRFAAARTWRAQCDAGLKTDSSLGFAERAGFRAGLAVPFQPWSFADNRPYDLWEVPLVLMDVTLKEYMHFDIDDAIEKSRKIIETLQAYGAGAAILWHNSSLNELDWRGWDRVYDDWLGNIRRLDGWGTSVGQMVDAWQRHTESLGN